ncbi:MAG: hypothetical protein IPI49_05410 [Myxococcales bacterium]|nr:hypothetical protein [Myxococcales bacterium]
MLVVDSISAMVQGWRFGQEVRDDQVHLEAKHGEDVCPRRRQGQGGHCEVDEGCEVGEVCEVREGREAGEVGEGPEVCEVCEGPEVDEGCEGPEVCEVGEGPEVGEGREVCEGPLCAVAHDPRQAANSARARASCAERAGGFGPGGSLR